jgi:hypothetical protein
VREDFVSLTALDIYSHIISRRKSFSPLIATHSTMALIPLLRIKSTHKLFASLILSLLTYLYFTASHTSKSSTTPWTPICTPSSLRIATATILYSPSTPPSLTLHNHYVQTHDYKLHVLRTPLVRGFANPLLWLHSLIVAELQKPVETQTEWILYALLLIYLRSVAERMAKLISLDTSNPSPS